jgi:hypothetical protein
VQEVVIEEVLSDAAVPGGLLGVVTAQHLAELRDYTARLRQLLDRLTAEAADTNGRLPLNDLKTALER